MTKIKKTFSPLKVKILTNWKAYQINYNKVCTGTLRITIVPGNFPKNPRVDTPQYFLYKKSSRFRNN